MATDQDIIALIDKAFGDVARPEYFCTQQYFDHDEATDHDRLLSSRTRESLTLDDVGNGGWDPLCFASGHGIAYFMPTLARLALEAPANSLNEIQSLGWGWYGHQLLFHLYDGFTDNKFWRYCDDRQKAAIAAMIVHWIESRASWIEEWETDQILRAYELWRTVSPEADSEQSS